MWRPIHAASCEQPALCSVLSALLAAEMGATLRMSDEAGLRSSRTSQTLAAHSQECSRKRAEFVRRQTGLANQSLSCE